MKFIYLIIFILFINEVLSIKQCKIKPNLECTKELPCLWSDTSTWADLTVPTGDECVAILNGLNTGVNRYVKIDLNIDIKTIELQQNVIVIVEIPPVEGVHMEHKIDTLKITQSNITFKSTTPKATFTIKNLNLLDSANIEISSWEEFKIGNVTINEKSGKFNISDSTVNFDGEMMMFKKKPIFKSSIINIKFESPINKDDCIFTDGISGIGSNVTFDGACKLSGKSKITNFIRIGPGFELMDSSELMVTGNFDNQESFDIGLLSRLIFQLENTDDGNQDDEDDGESSEVEMESIKKIPTDLIIKHLNFRGYSTLEIGGSNETSNQYKSVTIENINYGSIIIDNVVSDLINMNKLEKSTITSELDVKISISNSVLLSFKTIGTSSSEVLSLTFEKNVTVIKNMTLVNGEIEFGQDFKLGMGSNVFISKPKQPVMISGDLTMLPKSSIIIEDLSFNIVVKGVNSMIELNNASITCYNLTMNSGTLKILNQSTINVNHFNLYGNSSIDIPEGNQNKLFVNGNLNIYSELNKIIISKLGKISSWLSVSRGCLLNGGLDLHFSNIEPQSEYHILSCSKYTNSFKTPRLFINELVVDSSTFQIEPRTNALYLLYKEENYKVEEVDQTLNGWTWFTALLISAIALAIISFYLIYKKKFKFRKQSYIPVEMDIMMKDTNEEDQY